MKNLLYGFIIISTSSIMSMDEHIDININGEEMPLLEHINKALYCNPNHLRLVDFIRWNTATKNYELLAQGKPALSEEEISDADSNNYVFISSYKIEQRGFDIRENVAAVVFGIKDRNCDKEVCFAAMRLLLEAHRLD